MKFIKFLVGLIGFLSAIAGLLGKTIPDMLKEVPSDTLLPVIAAIEQHWIWVIVIGTALFLVSLIPSKKEISEQPSSPIAQDRRSLNQRIESSLERIGKEMSPYYEPQVDDIQLAAELLNDDNSFCYGNVDAAASMALFVGRARRKIKEYVLFDRPDISGYPEDATDQEILSNCDSKQQAVARKLATAILQRQKIAWRQQLREMDYD